MTSDESYANIPQELKERRQWVCYRIEERDGKKTKIPYRTDKVGLGRAKTNDPATWHTFEEVVEAVGKPINKFDGIGFMLSESDPYVFIDLDHVVDGGVIEGWAREIIDRVGSYTEFSQSGKGIHIIARATKPGPRCRMHRHPKLEIYENVRLVVFTGNLVPGLQAEIVDAQRAVDEVYFGVFGENPRNAPPKEAAKNVRPVGTSDPALIEKAMSAANGDKFGRLWNGNTGDYNGDDSSADMALCCMLAFWTQRDPARMDRLFRESGLMRDKWDQKRGDRTYGEMTIDAAIGQTAEVYRGCRGGRNKPKVADDGLAAARERTAHTRGMAVEDFPLTDLGNAERLIAAHGANLRFNEDSDKWLVWNARYWQPDNTGKIDRLAREVVRGVADEIASLCERLKDAHSEEERKALYSRMEDLQKHMRNSESCHKLEAMVKLARHCSGVPVLSSQLDSNPWLLNCANGTIDLKTGDLNPHAQSDLMAKMVPVDYSRDANSPRWKQFLDEVFQGNADLVAFAKRVAGYALTGDTREECLFILTGKGQNGKTRFVETLRAILGEYAQNTPVTTFTEHRDANSFDLPALAGARLVTAAEGEGTQAFHESLLKQLTGGDPVTCCFKFKDYFTYTPAFKVLFSTNEIPRIRSQNTAMKRRIKLIPFRQRFYDPEDGKQPVKDDQLKHKLLAELPGILRWMVEGCLEWQDKGLNTPAIVRQEVDRLFEDQDPLGEFIEAECLLEPRTEVEVKRLWDAYLTWCEQNGRLSAFKQAQWFSRNLVQRDGIDSRRGTGGTRMLTGIKLLGEPDKPPSTGLSDESDENQGLSDTYFGEALMGKVSENGQNTSLTSLSSVKTEPKDVGFSGSWGEEDRKSF